LRARTFSIRIQQEEVMTNTNNQNDKNNHAGQQGAHRSNLQEQQTQQEGRNKQTDRDSDKTGKHGGADDHNRKR